MSQENNTVLTVEITDENIRKAYETLGIPLASEENEEEEVIVKAEKDDLEDTKKDKAEKLKKQIEGEGAVKDKTPDASHEDDEDNDEIKGEKETNSKSAKKEKDEEEEPENKSAKSKQPDKKIEKASAESQEEDKDEKKEIKKAEDGMILAKEVNIDGDLLIKGENLIDIIKAETNKIAEKLNAVGLLEKALSDALTTKFISIQELVNDIQKAVDDHFNSVEERLEAIENTPIPRKSVTRQGDILTKGEDNELGDEGGIQTLSITRDKKQVTDILKAKSGIDGGTPNETFMNALLGFEASGTITSDIRKRLLSENKVNLIN